jgi:L-threonylcarbamoyladenylate synthase
MTDHEIFADDPRAALESIRSLAIGHLACLPTDTLYGIHGLATFPGMVDKLAEAKGYDVGERGFILLVKDASEIARWAELDDSAAAQVQRYAGSPISFIFKALPDTPSEWTTSTEEGEARIAFRTPDTPFLQELLGYLDAPLLSTSANEPGEPPLASAAEIVKLFGDAVDIVISDPELEARVAEEGIVPSTLVDLTCRPPRVLREGKVPFVMAAGA